MADALLEIRNLSKRFGGVLASNGALVERAVTILNAMNCRVLGPEDVRAKLKLKKRG